MIVNPGPVSTFIVRKIIVRKIHIDSPALQYITIANTAQQDSSLISADINADLGIQSGRPIKKKQTFDTLLDVDPFSIKLLMSHSVNPDHSS